jgi:hypothetical protein
VLDVGVLKVGVTMTSTASTMGSDSAHEVPCTAWDPRQAVVAYNDHYSMTSRRTRTSTA